jgi:protein-tyrosine phosphatase
VSDYLETVHPADPGRRTARLAEYEALVSDVLQRCGTTTEQSFRDALAGLDVDALLAAAGLAPAVRESSILARAVRPSGCR